MSDDDMRFDDGPGEAPARKRPDEDPPFDQLPLNGLVCSDCGTPQRMSYGGAVCAAGHGGAPGVEPPPKKAYDHRLVFLDFETSGLNPVTDYILEVGVTVVSSELDYRMSIGSDEANGIFFHRYPQHPNINISEIVEGSDEFVRKLHAESGLVADSLRNRARGVKTLAQIEAETIGWLSKGHGFAPKVAVLAGSSIHFDRGFITHQMPKLDAFLHYRMLDVSAIREAYMRWVDPDWSATWKAMQGHATHRVKDDIRASVDELRFFREKLFR